MFRTFISILASMLLLNACATRQATTTQRITDPPVGVVVTRGIGEPLISQGMGVFRSDIILAKESQVGRHNIPPGKYSYDDENATGIWFSGDNQYFYIKKADDTICVDGKDCAKIEYSLSKRPVFTISDSLQQTLLYNGRIGNRITLAYREFSNNLARPAFSNSVEYDINESTTVGYKGARLEIIGATNTDITYRVVAGFSYAEVR